MTNQSTKNDSSSSLYQAELLVEAKGRQKWRVLVIDANAKGNIMRHINHSCEPNCELVQIQINGEERVFVVSLENDIEKGTFLGYDYGDNRDEFFPRCLCRKCCIVAKD